MSNAGKYGSGSGTTRLYVVEARTTGHESARVVNGVLLTREWQRLATTEVHPLASIEARRIAVPTAAYPAMAKEHGLLEREAAYALAIRFQVESDEGENRFMAGHAVLCVETRLVEVKLNWSFDIEEVGVCDPVSLFEQLRYLKSAPREVAQGRSAVDPSAGSTGTPPTRA